MRNEVGASQPAPMFGINSAPWSGIFEELSIQGACLFPRKPSLKLTSRRLFNTEPTVPQWVGFPLNHVKPWNFRTTLDAIGLRKYT
jgi:hypothetical protein